MQRTSSTSLVQPLICTVLVTQEQMPNMTPNATINVVMPLNASKCQCHLMITLTVIATIIVMCQHMHKTTAPVQLSRLQQATISWYWCSKSWSQTVVGQTNSTFTCAYAKKVTACATVPTNAWDAMWRAIIVNAFLSLRKRKYVSSYKHCVPAHLVFYEISNTYNWLPVQFIHFYHPQDGKVHWVNDYNRNTITKICFIKMIAT